MKDNKTLRQVFSMAFNREQYSILFYNGTGRLPQPIISTNVVVVNKSGYLNPYSTYNLKKEKKYLAAAGYPHGEWLAPMILDTATGGNKQQAKFFVQCMDKIGIKINLCGNILPELLKKMGKKTIMMHSISWVAYYDDAATFLGLLHHSDETGTMPIYDATYEALYEK